jgi:hypothetical protein
MEICKLRFENTEALRQEMTLIYITADLWDMTGIIASIPLCTFQISISMLYEYQLPIFVVTTWVLEDLLFFLHLTMALASSPFMNISLHIFILQVRAIVQMLLVSNQLRQGWILALYKSEFPLYHNPSSNSKTISISLRKKQRIEIFFLRQSKLASITGFLCKCKKPGNKVEYGYVH